MRYVIGLLVAIGTFWSTTALAVDPDTTKKIAFQARLTGVPDGSTYNVQLTFKRNGANPVTLASPLTNVNVTSGVMSIVINDSNVDSSTFSEVASAPSLTVDVDINSGTYVFSGIPITAVPSALVARTAIKLDPNVPGSVVNTNIANGTIGAGKFAAGAITAGDIAAGAVVAGKLGAGAVNLGADVSGTLPRANGGTGLSAAGVAGNVLTSDGTNWTSAAPAGPTGAAGGDLSGAYPNPTIAAGAITSAKILDGSIATADIAAGAITDALITNVAWAKITSPPAFVLSSGGTMTGALGIPAGSAAVPSLSFSGDTDTGIFSPLAGYIAFSNNASEAMRINAIGNVGIGTTAPSSKLTVSGNVDVIGGGSLTVAADVIAPGFVMGPPEVISSLPTTLNCSGGSLVFLTAAPGTLNLPAAASCPGKIFILKRTVAGSVSLAPSVESIASVTAGGAAGSSVMITSDGSNWLVLSKY